MASRPNNETNNNTTDRQAPEPRAPIAAMHATFRKWLGEDYDTDSIDVAAITAAVERLDGDPLWSLIVSGSGNAKTETVQALDGIGAHVIAAVSSAGALLSATSQKERTDDSTGGLLRKIGPSGVLVIKDVTTILSMNRDARAEVLAALREVYDGRWSRNVGTDGGKTLEWKGRIAVIGAVTTAWDRAHEVISSMGDRFVLLRVDSTKGRLAAGRQAIANTGTEVQMRHELAQAVADVMARIDLTQTDLTEAETAALLNAADLVTRSRTGVEYDYRGDVVDAHAPEMPTRFAKQLAQIVRGGVALGMDREQALRLAVRCARDSMPPLRLAIVDDLAAHPDGTTADVRKRLGKPRATVDRQLQALHMLDVLECDEEQQEWGTKVRTVWTYRLSEGIDPEALKLEKRARFVGRPSLHLKGEGGQTLQGDTNTTGTPSGEIPTGETSALDNPRHHAAAFESQQSLTGHPTHPTDERSTQGIAAPQSRDPEPSQTALEEESEAFSGLDAAGPSPLNDGTACPFCHARLRVAQIGRASSCDKCHMPVGVAS